MLKIRPGDEDTICALATAPGVGALALVRVSGARALELVRPLASFLPERPLSHHAYFGTLKFNGAVIDQVLMTYFSEGKSFTGEESVEISCHGGDQVSRALLQALGSAGVRTAKPGEFTYRAFMHGKIDLVQAESILALIESRSAEGSTNALAQLQGELSARFLQIEDDLLWINAQLEASIDFSSDGIEIKASKELFERAKNLESRVGALIASYKKGRILRNGLSVAIVGAPNVGKSSLLNAIVEEDRAIVTEHAGTTRDLIEVETRFEGTPIRWIDTAGIRETSDEIEKLGVEKTLRARASADVVAVIIDLSRADWRDTLTNFARAAGPSEMFIFNKIDLDRTGEWRSMAESECEKIGAASRVHFVSALTKHGIEDLKAAVAKPIREKTVEAGVAVSQARHLEGLERIQLAVGKGLELIQKDASPELIAFELQIGVKKVHELLGKEFHEQVIDRIFKEFCLGK